MVLERLIPEAWLEQRYGIAILLGFVFASVGMIFGTLLFGVNAGVVNIVFTTLLLLPVLSSLLRKEERAELRRLSLRSFFNDNRRALGVYASLFFGLFLAYVFYSFFVPWLGHRTEGVFIEQLAYGSGIFSSELVVAVLQRWWILLACFLLALLAGDGALFFIVWNASVWGSVVGAKAVASSSGFSPWIALLLAFLFALPWVILEGAAYILAMIAGGVISDEIGVRHQVLKRFLQWSVPSALFVVVVHLLLASFLPSLLMVFLDLLLVIVALLLLSRLFKDEQHRRVFRYNTWLFAGSFGLFCIGAVLGSLLFLLERTLF